MSTKKFIEIKFLYFLKPNSSLAFFPFPRSRKTRNLSSQSQRSKKAINRGVARQLLATNVETIATR